MRTIHLDNDNEVNEFIIENLKEQKKELEDYNDKLNNMGKRYANTIAKAIEYIKNNIADPDFMKREYGEKVIETSEIDIYVKNIKELLDILQGGDLDE